ncbi:hypothetical protein, partial [Serratia fonticola]|uniref:hypothetical protein n=1 Tax=Serratia fonticola TaxID=47917 RepID=UPI00301DD7E9
LKNNQLLLAIQKLMGTAVGGLVKSVNNYDPDTSGNVELPMPGIGTNAVALSTANALTELCNYGGGKFTASAGSSGMPTNAVAYALDWTPTAG